MDRPKPMTLDEAKAWMKDRWLLAQQLKPLKDRAGPWVPVVPDYIKERGA